MVTKSIKNLSVGKKLGVVVGLISIIALFEIAISIISSSNNYSRSSDMADANKASDYILLAAGQEAFERGATTTVLASPNDRNTYSRIASLRQTGDSYLDSALAIAKELAAKNEDASKKYAELEQVRNRRDEMRKQADMILTRSAADKQFIQSWIKVQTEHIMKSNELANALFVSDNQLERVLGFNSIVKNAIFHASEFAGRERAGLGAVIGSGLPISGEVLNNLMRYRGVVEENIRAILDLRNNSNITPDIRNAINNMESTFLIDFQRTREAVYKAGQNKSAYPLNTSEWIEQSTSAINSILKVSETVSHEAHRLAEEQNAASTKSLFFSALTLAILALIVFTSIWIARLITRPVISLADAATKVSMGDLNQSVDYVSNDEVGKLSSAFNKMVENISEAGQELREEKAGVERKVEEAVKESEEQRKYLERSTEMILTEMDKFANGDLTVQLEKEKDDVIGALFDGFNKVVLNIREMIEKVTEAVEAAASASSEISSSTEELAAGAQEQSAQTTEVAGAVEEMTKTIFETTSNVTHASETAKNSGNIARDGGKVVSDTIGGMNRIAEVITQAAETVKELGSSSDKIGEIVQVIDDIADQTNLLALNAAIEAARAGEQGRGFAVVADEVRKLAERTTKATKEIASMIKEIQKDTNNAVVSMVKGTEEVNNGKQLAQKAGEALNQIISSSKEVVDNISQVAAASEEQSSAAEQISKNIESISSVTNQSAAGVQQIARAAEDLNNLTVNLQNLVSQFTISKDGKSIVSNLAVRQNGKLVHA